MVASANTTSIIAALAFIAGVLPVQTVFAQPLQLIGTARALDADATAPALYEEQHSFDADGSQRKVSYFRDGKAFAAKTIDYSPNAVAPNFVQHDTRRGEMMAARRDRLGRIELDYREKAGDAARWKIIEASTREVVIDAGFDNFVQRHWQQLLAGDAIHFDFAVPSRSQAVHLVIVSTSAEQCGQPRIASSHCFRVYAGNYLVRLFFPSLHLLYAGDAQLQRFLGLSNINDERGNGQQVRIDYRRVLSQH